MRLHQIYALQYVGILNGYIYLPTCGLEINVKRISHKVLLDSIQSVINHIKKYPM